MFQAFLGMDADELHLEMASREFAELEAIEHVAAAGKDVGVGVIDASPAHPPNLAVQPARASFARPSFGQPARLLSRRRGV